MPDSSAEPLFNTEDDPAVQLLADRVRSYICELGPGDHGHTDCWHLSMAAEVIELIDGRDAIWSAGGDVES